MDTPWQITLFGGLRVQGEERVISRFATAKTAALLAYLALYPKRLHPREELVDLFWPDSDLEAGRTSLRSALASLRRQLEPPGTPPGSVLIADRLHVRLNPLAVTTDVAAFEAALKSAARAETEAVRQNRLRRAVEAYGGDLLPGFYDEWALTERERFALLHKDALRRCETGGADAEMPAPEPEKSAPTLPAPRLPLQWTRFFGRERERAQIGSLLSHCRLVTVSGPGGAGKTRLAVEAAREAAPAFENAVTFVPLADLNDAARIPDAVCRALRLPETAGQEPLEQAAQALSRSLRPLLVLDNLEHLAGNGAATVLTLLTRVPALTILATSRRRLALPGEREFVLPSLPVPEGAPDPERMAQCASVQLFVDRTQAIRPDFQVTRSNAAAIAGLCADLEGLPLALELAAARAQTLTPAQMRAQLSRRFEVLTTRHADKDARHRSLRATIAWSVDLLPPPLRRFWACLSVFRGGGTTEAAQAVTGETQALECWTQLRERSLLFAEEGGAGMRFRLLESLREFAAEQLDAEERDDVARRHAAYFLTLALASEPKLRGADQAECLTQLEDDHDNFRAALDWAGEHDPELELQLASALSFFWSIRGFYREGRARLEQALSRASAVPDPLRAKALHSAGVLSCWQCDYPAARTFYTEAVALRRHSGERIDLLRSLQNLASVYAYQGEHHAAKSVFEESLPLCRELGNGPAAMPTLLGLAIIAEWQGEWAQARALYQDCLHITRNAGDRRNEAATLFNLGELERGQGNAVFAADALKQSLALARELGDQGGIARAVISLGYVAAAQNALEEARALFDEGLALNRELGDPDGIANAGAGFGDIACRRGDWAAARAAYAEALASHQQLGDLRQVTAGLHRLGVLAARQEQAARGARLLGATQSLRASLSSRMSPLVQSEWDAALLSLRATLSPAAFDAAFAEGAALSPDDAVTLALEP